MSDAVPLARAGHGADHARLEDLAGHALRQGFDLTVELVEGRELQGAPSLPPSVLRQSW